MKNKKMRAAVYGVALLMLAATALLYQKLPEKIPMHWDFNNAVRYDSKAGIWGICVMTLVLAAMFDFLPKIDPRKKNYEKFGKYYDGFCLFMQLFMAVMWGIIIIETFWPGSVSVGKSATLMCGVMFLFMGNMLPKARSNFYLGIKTPWTLSDDEIWRRSNRLGGKMMFAAGAVSIIAALLMNGKNLAVVFFTVMIASAAIPCIMSYVWWRQKEEAHEQI